MSKNKRALFTSNNQVYETPDYLFKELSDVFRFKLDVCASNENAKCQMYFTEKEDGLSQKWLSVNWMNPPYNNQKYWLEKAYIEYIENGHVTVCLIPARTDTKLWQDFIFKEALYVCFIKGRLKFKGCKYTAPFASALVIFAKKLTDKQLKCLYKLGKVI